MDNNAEPRMAKLLRSSKDVVRCLVTYVDWWQPSSASALQIDAIRRRRDFPGGIRSDGFRPGLLESLDERAELCWRMRFLTDRDREMLFLWYVAQRPVDEIAEALDISRRQCYRRRNAALETLIQLGEPGEGSE